MFYLSNLFAIWGLSLMGYTTAQYSATYLPSNVPAKTEQGQAGTNQCGTGSNQNSECQNAFINSVTDFCLFAPPTPGPGSVIGNTERIEVAWCIQSGTGARLIPDGAIRGAHFVQTPDFVQVTGIGDLTLINIPAGDAGGELDPHGADGNGNPIGGLVFSSAFGQVEQLHEWTNFVSDTEFCFRACKPGPMAATFCQHIYDVMGCEWNMPANYGTGFESCQADSGEPMGVYGTSTFFQGQPVTPPAHPIPSSSRCQVVNTVGNGILISTTPLATPTPNSSSSAASSASIGSSATVSSPGIGASSSANSPQSSSAVLPGSSSGSSQGASSSVHTPTPTTSSAAASNTANAAVMPVSYSQGWKGTAMTIVLALMGHLFGGLFIL